VTLAGVEPGRKKVLIVEDWAEIRRLRRSEGVSISEIARVVGCSRNTVKAALASEGPPRYERAPAGSLVDGYEPRIRELLRAFPRMPATVIAERVGWPYSIRTLSGRVAELRPAYLPPDPAGRTCYAAGEVAQCDFWFPDVEVPVGFGQTRAAKLLPVLTMVCGYSRFALAMLLPSRSAEDLYAGWWQLIEQLGAVPRVLVWDGEGAVGRWRARRVELTGHCQGFRGTLGTKVIICTTRRPRA
jgi:transposase